MSCAAIHDRMVPDVKAPCTCRVQVNKYTIAWYLTLRTPFNDVEGLKTTVPTPTKQSLKLYNCLEMSIFFSYKCL